MFYILPLRYEENPEYTTNAVRICILLNTFNILTAFLLTLLNKFNLQKSFRNTHRRDRPCLQSLPWTASQ